MARTRVFGGGPMKLLAAVVIGVTASAPAVLAQDSVIARKPAPRDSGLGIPADARPPAGMCRIWLADVPVAQQPAPTHCATAVRNRPARGRVIFGDDYVQRESRSKAPPFVKGFAPASKATRAAPATPATPAPKRPPRPDTLFPR